MLSVEDNHLLTAVGAGTPTGELMRRFWIPALLSDEVLENDGAPVRVRLLGEDLVAFRDSLGRVGLLDEQCPHRRSSLVLAANENCGLRCLYHGWKFDVEGKCVDTPGEPENSTIKDRIRTKAYPTVERGGVVWAYMGPPEEKPAFPEYEWLNMPEGQSMVFKVQEDCNYAQAVEGTIDTAHAGILHRSVRWDDPGQFPHEQVLQAKLEIEYTGFGLRYAGLRTLPDGRTHARMTVAPLPFFTIIPPDGGQHVRAHRRMANAFVPRDDYTTWHVQWFFDSTRPVDRAFRIQEGGLDLDENFRKRRNIETMYGQDRAKMKAENFSGIDGILVQDHAVVETQGVIVDRSKEHLGTSDIAVVAWRRAMLRAAKDLAATGARPSGLDAPAQAWADLKGIESIIPEGQTWKDLDTLPEAFVQSK